jgi:Putative prokaryotic signal transducing protein
MHHGFVMAELNPEQLAKRYAELSDAALSLLVQSESLNVVAQEIAIAELRQRGVHWEPIKDSAETDDLILADTAIETNDSLSLLAQFDFSMDAHLLQSRLQEEGIPAWVMNANTAQVFGYLRSAVGGARVMVPTHLVEPAADVLRRLQAGEYALDESDEVS